MATQHASTATIVPMAAAPEAASGLPGPVQAACWEAPVSEKVRSGIGIP
jgi:hypothetical protein